MAPVLVFVGSAAVRPALVIIAGAAIAIGAAFLFYERRGPGTQASAFGSYRGYADAGYDGTKRVSAYLRRFSTSTARTSLPILSR
jgi:hypothetical protein